MSVNLETKQNNKNGGIKLAKGNIPINEELLYKYATVREIFDSERNNYNGNIIVKSEIDELKNLNIKESNAENLKKIAYDILNKYNEKNEFENDGNKIIVSKAGINESIEKIYYNKKQRGLIKEHLLVSSALGDIIENATLVNQTPELKNKRDIKYWNYYFDGLKINNELYHLEFDVRSMTNAENQYRVQRLEKSIKKASDQGGDLSNTTNILPPNSLPAFSDNNIPQLNTNVNNKFSQALIFFWFIK